MPQANKVAVPEAGQIVEVRGSTWAVSHVVNQGLMRSPADEGVAGSSHVVELQSLDEDRMGEQLQVVWELEVGHSVNPSQGLPQSLEVDGFDDPSKLAGFIDALRWGAVTSARKDRFQAPFWSGAKVEAYQLEPLRRALEMPRTNLLLADDVGLGKTIEAGLVIQELLLRHRARSVMIVCPPSLALKWQDEMREKFGLEFEVVNSAKMAEVRRTHGLQANPFRIFPRVIVSMAWLSTPRAQRLLRNVYQGTADKTNVAKRYAFDVLVVDEAHHVAPVSPTKTVNGRGYAVDSQRTIATRELAEHCEHRLFLSATPHNGHSESFTALLEMIDSRRFARGADLNPEALKAVTVRRLKSDLPGERFQKRRVETIAFEPSEKEQEMFTLLEQVLGQGQQRGKKAKADVVTMLLKKRFLSSAFAFGMSIRNYLEAQYRNGDFEEWESEYDELFGEGAADEEEGLFEQPEAESLRELRDEHVLAGATDEQLETLAHWGLEHENVPDSRAEELLQLLDGICRPGGTWSNERVVVFTEYAHTVQWLQRVLETRGYGTDRLSVIQGSTDTEERELIRARFTADPQREPVRVLLATDAAGEGIDLQTYCHRLVNFDIPFNPSRLEQRIGRIDRYGQTQQPTVYHFKPVGSSSTYTADMKMLEGVARKIAQVEIDLGSANQVVGAEIQNQFLGTAKSPKKSRSVDPNDVITRALAGGIELNRQLTQLESDFEESKSKLHLEPANLRRVVDTALELNNQQPLVPNFDLRGEDEPDAEVFDLPQLTAGWHSTLRGLAHRLSPEVQRPITFDGQFAAGRDDVVHVHLGHPLVQKSQRLLRSALWGSDQALNRVTAVEVAGLAESAAVAVVRMALVGKGGVRLHEDVFLAGVRLTGSKTKMAESKTVDALETALDGSDLHLASDAVREHLSALWVADGKALQQRLEQRVQQLATARAEDVEQQLKNRCDADIERVQKIFAAFKANLNDSLNRIRREQEELKAQAEGALFMFADKDQERQWRRDVNALETRLDALDQEMEREIELVRMRYDEVKPHTMTAAVVFAVTAEDAKNWGK